MSELVIPLSEVDMNDVGRVGGKNASLGEMIQNLSNSGVPVPGGFATTAEAYRKFLAHDNLDQRIAARLAGLNVDDVRALAGAGADIRGWILDARFPLDLCGAITKAWQLLPNADQHSWAVRSSATAEDLPDASFAGQQETYLNITGLPDVLTHIQKVFASLYTDRAIAYRDHQGFEHSQVALSAGVQQMIRSDKSGSGVMFTLDTESGFRDVVFITASYGLGEMVVQGAVNPDEYVVYKPAIAAGNPAVLRREPGSKAERMVFGEGDNPVHIEPVPDSMRQQLMLSDAEAESLAKMAITIEQHYGRPMDIEWAKDGIDGELYIVQARPETVESRRGHILERYELTETGPVLAEGRAIGARIGAGNARVLHSLDDMHKLQPGDVLVTDMTDPDWEPVMKRAAAIVTNRGGRTCHAAIIARELGVPAVVGCGNASEEIPDGAQVTVSCAEGDTGFVYSGVLDFIHDEVELDNLPAPPVKMMMNVGNPERAFHFRQIPNHGVGLARLEFIISNMIGVHPKAALHPTQLSVDEQRTLTERSSAWGSPRDYYVRRMAEGISTIAAAFAPEPVILRLSDFKSNEYANLLGGQTHEPHEENPMIGFRGAGRYIDPSFRECFELECEAVKYVRETMGFNNLQIMIPFVRTVPQAVAVLDELATYGLRRGENGLKIIMMCEVPSNALLADEFLKHFDGFSIGSNDLTQLTLAVDRDSSLVAQCFDERDPAVKVLLKQAIDACKKQGKYIGICGQGPSDHPDLAQWLVEQNIESLSLNPDTVVQTWLDLSHAKHS